jgi:hypothetical protein
MREGWGRCKHCDGSMLRSPDTGHRPGIIEFVCISCGRTAMFRAATKQRPASATPSFASDDDAPAQTEGAVRYPSPKPMHKGHASMMSLGSAMSLGLR